MKKIALLAMTVILAGMLWSCAGGEEAASLATMSGQPTGVVNYSTANITVDGAGIVAYKYKLDTGTWSAETSVSSHIVLSGLSDGVHSVYVIGKDAAGNWQAEASATTASWRVEMLGAYYSVGRYPTGICFDGTNIWVTNNGSGTVTKLRASDGTTLGTYEVGDNPWAICFDGANIWVANGGSDNVTKLRASDGSTLGTYSVGSGPVGICFDGANIWVANQEANSVTKLRASDGSTLGTYSVGSCPEGICFDGANIWVTNYESHTVTKLSA